MELQHSGEIERFRKRFVSFIGDNNNSDENIVDLKNFKSDKTPIHKLVPNKFQPRKNFDKKQLDDLQHLLKVEELSSPLL